MRKIIVILLGIFGCLLFTAGGTKAFAYAGHASVMLSVDRASDDQWLCEREYNADLNLPRVMGEVAPAPAVPVFLRSGQSFSVYVADRYAAERSCAGSGKIASEFRSSYLFVGLHAVDYYVYCLRRLII